MNSYIDEYNNLVDKKCKEQMKVKKDKSINDLLSGKTKYNKEFNAYVAIEPITKKQFIINIKNAYKYLGQSIPKDVELEDIYAKVFNTFSMDEFIQFMDIVQFGGHSTLNDAYRAFLDELRIKENVSSDLVEVDSDLVLASNSLFEEIESEIGSIPPTQPSSLMPSRIASPPPELTPELAPYTKAEISELEKRETSASGVLSEGLVSRRGRPFEVELPQEIMEELNPARNIFSRMSMPSYEPSA